MPVADMAASFQAAVVDVLVKKAAAAAEEFGAKAVHITGGVSANSSLREEMSSKVEIPVRFPPKDLCTDNAAMIAAAAHQRYIAGFRDSLDLDVLPSFRLA
jgi:N6-L-threonylcarbamoyladenine synthase